MNIRLLVVILAPFIVVVGSCGSRVVVFAVLGAGLAVLVFKVAGGAFRNSSPFLVIFVIFSVVGVA